MEPDILLKLQKVPGYTEGHIVAMPMCSVCKLRNGRNCEIYGKPPKNILMKHQYCDKAKLDKDSNLYEQYMELYGYRHKDDV